MIQRRVLALVLCRQQSQPMRWLSLASENDALAKITMALEWIRMLVDRLSAETVATRLGLV